MCRCPCGWWETIRVNARTLEPIHVLVADDELPARQRLIDLLRRDEPIEFLLDACQRGGDTLSHPWPPVGAAA